MGSANDNGELTDAEIDRIAEALFRKFARVFARVGVANAGPSRASACESPAPQVKPSAAAIERERARRARKGVL